MSGITNWTALSVFAFFFLLVTFVGFFAARWKRAANLEHIDEWGLGGRQFGTWVTWFLIGGDFYTAYTVIAVPALVYTVGGYGFFALPYTIVVYPLIYVIMPALWSVAHRHGHVTAGDIVMGQYKSRHLELAVAVTGVIATMPYIALQLVGIGVVIKALGLPGEASLIVAFIILALYTYSSGLRAPALIAFVKDVMIYIVVIAAVVLIPYEFGGYGSMFQVAAKALSARGPGSSLLIPSGKLMPYASLALGSALAAFMYPHTLTGVLAAKSSQTIRRNAILLPIYTVLLALIAMMGYMAYAAGVVTTTPNDVVPMLFQKAFSNWFVGFAFAAVAIGALVPAAVMSIGAANLFSRNFWKAYVAPNATPAEEAKVAKIVSLLVKLGALIFTLYIPLQYSIYLQLLGGLWILQTFPALVFGLWTKFFTGPGLLAGWAVGFFGGSYIAINDGLVPIHVVGGYGVYIGLLALIVNIIVAAIVSAISPAPREAAA